MKLIYLILSAGVCYSGVMVSSAQENYSHWPRRPQEFEQAQLLLARQKWAEASHVLQPFVQDTDGFGSEARAIVGRINIVRYLSRMHPYSSVYTVRKGDSLPKIASKTKCPVDLLMLFNGLTTPSALKIGQKLVFIDMPLRLEIYPSLNELAVWDGDALVSSYKILSIKGDISSHVDAETVKVSSRESYIQGKRIPDNSAQISFADKLIRFSNGVAIFSRELKDVKTICLSQKDVNELALLVRAGNDVLWKP